jgi:outer membrane biogenesis lipoprotein LolB
MKNIYTLLTAFAAITLMSGCAGQSYCPAYNNSGFVQPTVKHKKKKDKRIAHYTYKQKPTVWSQITPWGK